MVDSKRSRLVAIAVAAVAVVVAFSVGYFALTHSSSPASSPEPKTYLNLTISSGNATEMGNYTTPFISITANTIVVVTIDELRSLRQPALCFLGQPRRWDRGGN